MLRAASTSGITLATTELFMTARWRSASQNGHKTHICILSCYYCLAVAIDWGAAQSSMLYSFIYIYMYIYIYIDWDATSCSYPQKENLIVP